MEKPIIVLTGPTASGKTALSFGLAQKFNGEIICVDSMTVYRGMDIGTDKPTLGIQNTKYKTQNKDGSFMIKGIKHHMIDIVDPDEEFNSAISQTLINKLVADIHSRDKIPFLVGGSLLYIDSYVYNYQTPDIKPDKKLRQLFEKETNEKLFARLVKLDPDCEWTVDKDNRRRIIRALEVVTKTGKPLCEQRSKTEKPQNILYLAVKRDRQELYDKINRRVDEMMKEGFLKEVEALHQIYDNSTALQAAGYKQLMEYLEGKIDLDKAIEKTKQVHRNFAKRQLTWLKKNPDLVWITNSKIAENLIEQFLKS